MLRSKLSGRVALWFLVASLTPLIGVGTLTLSGLETSVRNNARLRHEALADYAAATVRGWISSGLEKLTTLSSLLVDELPELDRPARANLNPDFNESLVKNLNRLIEPPDLFLELQYYTTKGVPNPALLGQAQQRSYADVQQSNDDYQARQSQQILDNANGALVQEPLRFNRNHLSQRAEVNFGFPTLPLSVPVREAKRNVGAVVGYLDLRKLPQVLAPLRTEGLLLRLDDGEGRILASIGGIAQPTVGLTRPVGHGRWRVEVLESERVVTAAVAEARGQVIVWLALAAVLAIVLSLFLSSSIVRPVLRLTEAARRMQSGDLSARSEIVRDDEIGRLGEAFDRMAAALEQLDEAKSDFIGNVSHELRTPLTSMRLSLANLTDGVAGPLDERQAVALHRIQSDAERLIKLVDDLLAMARLEAGVEHVAPIDLDLAELARAVASSLESLAAERDVRIVVTGEGRALADSSMLTRVLTNLVDNAIKFSPEGGQVSVEVGDNVLRVRDQGPGLESETMFERFRQGDAEGVKNRGAGLGLSIVKKLVDLSGGTITATNDAGACFTVSLGQAHRSDNQRA